MLMTNLLFSPNFHVFYDVDSLSKPKEIREEVENHKLSNHKSDDNLLLDPSPKAHIILIYENQVDLNNAIATYINEGLKHGQLCVYASVNLANEGYLENFSSLITDYQENVKKGNLVVVDLVPYYVNAMVGNLEYYDRLKEELISIAHRDKNGIDKYMRLTGDCATLLLKNKHLEECILVEEWWHQNPIEGFILCPYPRTLLDQFPINAYISRLFHDHDIVIDSNGKLIPEYIQQIK
jgi:MEDS: MEthanogen/methylotroph, DcmR Sensory domain